MRCSPRPPLVTSRDRRAISDAMAADRRGYTPEWTVARGAGDAGTALNDILARYLEIQSEGLNAMPLRVQLEFLESLGVNVLAAQPARAPLVFKLLDTASGDATVSAGTRVAAVLPPPAPSLESNTTPPPPVAPEFFTEQDFTAMRGNLAAIFSIDPDADTYADHSSATPGDFAVFDTSTQVPHRLYLGHDELFNFKGSAQIVLSFDLAASRGAATSAPRPLLLDWEYLSVDGWQPLVLVEDGTRRFTRDGKITLAKFFGPPSKQDAVAGATSCWIRGSISSRLPLARIDVEAAGYLLRFAAIGSPKLQPGNQVQIEPIPPAAPATATATVVWVGDGRLMVDTPLAGATVGRRLRFADAVPGIAFGTITAASAPYFRVSVETAGDLLPGDIVTVDGIACATILQTDADSLYLDAPIDGAEPGLTIQLADALPPLRPDAADSAGALPLVEIIRARVGLGEDDLPLDNASLDGFHVDISKDFFPFGEQPQRFAAFYFACKEAFSRLGARIELHLAYSEAGSAIGKPRTVAEYYNGQRWVVLGGNDEYSDTSAALTDGAIPTGQTAPASAVISFVAPADWAEVEVNGDKQLWLRLRLAEGNYGQPLSLTFVPNDPSDPGKGGTVQTTGGNIRPPVLSGLTVSFRYFTNPQPLNVCLSENDFAFEDHSMDARTLRSPFAPFTPVLDTTPALHFGFSSKPPSAAINILVQVVAPAPDGDPQPFVWDYWGSRGWTELSVRDATAGLAQTGIVQFVGAADAVPRDGLGGSLYRIRARLKPGLTALSQIVRCGGFWLNAAWARQGKIVDRDGLGISNGNPDQTFALPIARAGEAAPRALTEPVVLDASDFERALDLPLAGVPILDGETVEVREWSGRGDDWQTVLAEVDLSLIRFEADPTDPTVKTAAWVRWLAQPHFYDSGPVDRHYVVERARGVFRFPGIGGFIPPAGASIVVSYVTGGSVAGNVPAGAIRELRSGVGFVQSVSNPLAAGGGAAAELLHDARDRGAQMVRNRGRAVSFEDYEWLALMASSEVARARALPLAGPDGRGMRGFVGIVLIPHSTEAQPVPSAQLCSIVLAALRACAPAGIAGGIRIVPPCYCAVGVRAEILPLRAEEAGLVEARVRSRLNTFLHPLTGGHDGRGRDFGESVYLSDIATLIEDTDGVDAVRFLQLMVQQAVYGEAVTVEPQQLVAAGDSQLKIIVPSMTYALA